MFILRVIAVDKSIFSVCNKQLTVIATAKILTVVRIADIPISGI